MKKYRIVSKRTKCIRKRRKVTIRLKKPEWMIEITKFDNSLAYRQRKFQENVILCGEAITYIASEDDLSETTYKRTLMRLLPQAMQVLSKQEQIIIESFYFCEVGDKEIGEIIGKSRRRTQELRIAALSKMKNFLKTH